MTTPQQQPQTMESTEPTGASARNVDAARATGSGTDAPYETERTGSSAHDVEAARATGPSADTAYPTERTGSPTDTTASAADSSTIGAESPARRAGTAAGESLFAEHELSILRSRWADVQASFVDDPRESVQKADGIVADLVDRLTVGLAEARSRLEEHWARGEQVSTENLRVPLKRYRDFFEKLLAV
jgi:hypothetical protein